VGGCAEWPRVGLRRIDGGFSTNVRLVPAQEASDLMVGRLFGAVVQVATRG
jgi:hypothetical protein